MYDKFTKDNLAFWRTEVAESPTRDSAGWYDSASGDRYSVWFDYRKNKKREKRTITKGYFANKNREENNDW